jgi:hypothetical protein
MNKRRLNKISGKRYEIKGGVFVVSNRPPILGEVAELSSAGLSFRYDTDEDVPLRFSVLELFSLDDNIQIKKLAVRAVWDEVLVKGKRNQESRFISLSERQRFLLALLIQKHGFRG